jgi:hypothetical protein
LTIHRCIAGKLNLAFVTSPQCGGSLAKSVSAWAAVAYVERNPLRARMVRRAEESGIVAGPTRGPNVPSGNDPHSSVCFNCLVPETRREKMA